MTALTYINKKYYCNQEEGSTGSQALDNVVQLSDVIRLTRTNESLSPFSQGGEFISKYTKYVWLGMFNFISNPLGIEAQLLLQEDIDNGTSVTFPMNINDIPVQSEIPNSVISMQPKLCSYMYSYTMLSFLL